MMNYAEFKEKLINTFNGKGYELEVRMVKKNNIQKEAIVKTSGRVSPTIYINDWFSTYEGNGDFEGVIESVDRIFNMPVPNGIETLLDNLDMDNITARLVNYDKNADRLEKIVHEKLLDLAIEIRYIVSSDEDGVMSFPITDYILNKMGITKEDAIARVKMNVKRNSDFCSMMGVMMGAGIELPINNFDEPMYILSNKNKVNGAVSIISTDVLDKVLDDMDLDEVIIIPSSIHEVIIINTNVVLSVEEVENIIKYVNTTEIDDEDFLSDRAYKYSKANGLQFA